MKSSAVIISLISIVLADAVTDIIAPTGSYPSGCSKDFSGEFELSVSAVSYDKRDLKVKKRTSTSCGADGILLVSLADGVLIDSKNRTGYIASNYQFQFDDPPQDGAIYTAGFSVCNNESLALGATTTFWECASGSFWNLYDRDWAAQCSEIQLIVLPCDGSSDSEASESSDGQVVATSQITTTVVKSISDGQAQVITTTVGVPLCQITDGQAQVQTTPCAAITTTAEATAVPISQYSDGQIQVTTPATAATTVVASATTTPASAETTETAETSATPEETTATPVETTSTPEETGYTTEETTSVAEETTYAAVTTPVVAGTTTAVGTTTANNSYTASLTPSASANGTFVSSKISSKASTAASGTTAGTTTSAATASTTAVTSDSLRISVSSFAIVAIGLLGAFVSL
ncbi:covalently-linked cell wall protein [Grosmannia clavigera kw1407]|uniref:Covalently-linked cell wall protein n=1 Tax=Grosmannia clavigera (strain kw1407 / UAMH 11150) TaxID=655863 RepID=F0X9N7_GROCL|nr:covalently-linked cell wall protein [Grosmannia clavigera kw1407]EFX05943.1 covalently-linked cell wall protein [Grosmannia clavigera kw1407]